MTINEATGQQPDGGITDLRQQVFRLGNGQNKWLVVLPVGVRVSTLVPGCLPAIAEAVRAKYGSSGILEWDHVEYLGRG